MEVIYIPILANGVICVASGIITFVAHKWNRRKLKKEFAKLHAQLMQQEENLKSLQAPNEPIENPTPKSEDGYKKPITSCPKVFR